jgi:hypothetical protein
VKRLGSSKADASCFGTAAGMTFTTTQVRGDQNRCASPPRNQRDPCTSDYPTFDGRCGGMKLAKQAL